MVSKSKKMGLVVGGLAVLAVVGGIVVSNGSKGADKGYRVAMITDTAQTVQDHSFNQVTWEGLQSWGKSHNYKEGQNYNYFLSKSPSDFNTNFQLAQKQGYDLQAGVGFGLHNAVLKNAKQYPKTKYALVDDEITGQKNVVNLMFRSEESSYLAGVAAATKAKESGSDTVGFIGGMHGSVIDRFEQGFDQGVASVDKNIKVASVYVNSYTDAPKGQQIAQTMIARGIKVIFAAAGSAGNGAFTATKNQNSLLTADSKDRIWMIGVDIDQHKDGIYKSKDGKEVSATLTTSLTQVGNGLKDVSNLAMKGKFPGGKTVWYGLKEKGVGITKGNLDKDELKAVNTAENSIIKGDTKVTVNIAK